jgi:hypothetical protein
MEQQMPVAVHVLFDESLALLFGSAGIPSCVLDPLPDYRAGLSLNIVILETAGHRTH